jgi:NADH-quinone oxidoreductase subunit N
MLAYSGIAQAGYILAPFAVAGTSASVGQTALKAIVTYLVIYVVMNLGAFAVVIAVARKTRSAEITSFGGLFQYARPHRGHVDLPVLAGQHPAAGRMVRQARDLRLARLGRHHLGLRAGHPGGGQLGDRVLLLRPGHALHVVRGHPDGDKTPIEVPASLQIALVLTVGITLIYGVFPQVVGHFTDSVNLLALGRYPDGAAVDVIRPFEPGALRARTTRSPPVADAGGG